MTACAMRVREVTIAYRGQGRKVPDAIREPGDAVRLFRCIVPDHVREHFLALYLNARHRPIGFRVIATGTADSALIHPREVFQAGILLGATALIVGHNHPSGDPSPSAEDREITDRLRQAGEILGVRLLDSLVFNEDGRWARIEPTGRPR